MIEKSGKFAHLSSLCSSRSSLIMTFESIVGVYAYSIAGVLRILEKRISRAPISPTDKTIIGGLSDDDTNYIYHTSYCFSDAIAYKKTSAAATDYIQVIISSNHEIKVRNQYFTVKTIVHLLFIWCFASRASSHCGGARRLSSLIVRTKIMNDEIRNIRRERWRQQRASSPETSNAQTSPDYIIPNLLRGPRVNKPETLIDLSNIGDEDYNCDHVEEISKPKPPLQLKRSSSDDECEIIDGIKPKAKAAKTINIEKKSNATSMTVFNPTFSICSYNIWFGEPYPAERMQRIASLILDCSPRPLFIGFQEVTRSLKMTLFPLLESAGYTMFCQDIVDCGGYGCAIGVKQDLCTVQDTHRAKVVSDGFMRYSDTSMHRGLLWVHVKICGSNDTTSSKHVIFTTTHLESYISKTDNGASQRLNQIRQATTFCTNYTARLNDNETPTRGEPNSMAIITGDLNWDDRRTKGQGVDPDMLRTVNVGNNRWIDAWLDRHPDQDGFTYDARMNPMLGGNLRRRFDRCLVQFPNEMSRQTVNIASTIGTRAIDGLIWRKEIMKWQQGLGLTGSGQFKSVPVLPSDHYGLFFIFGGPKASDI